MSSKQVCAKCGSDKYHSKVEITCEGCGSKEPRKLLCTCSNCGKIEESRDPYLLTTTSVEIRIPNKNGPYSLFFLDLCDECLHKFKKNVDAFKPVRVN